jgi:excisionase family DNA binding protein
MVSLVHHPVKKKLGGFNMTNAVDLTPRQAAIRLSVSLAHIYHLVWAGKLPAKRAGGRWQIEADAVEIRLKAREAANGTIGR